MGSTRQTIRRLATLAALGLLLGLLPGVRTPAGAVEGSDGYWVLAGQGGVYTFGTLYFGDPGSAGCPVSPLGDAREPHPDGTCWSMAATPSGKGYWVINALTGKIFPFGDAKWFGDPQQRFAESVLPSRPEMTTSAEFMPVMAQILPTPSGNGYWVYLVGLSGMGIVAAFGDAAFFGDTTQLVGQRLVDGYNGIPIGIARTADGKGYWETYSDGGVFAFGDARFYGSTGGLRLAAPVIGIEATATGKGYWLVASDGGVFAFGDARFGGSAAGLPHSAIVGMARNPAGPGYWVLSDSGQVFALGGAPALGGLSQFGITAHAFAITARR